MEKTLVNRLVYHIDKNKLRGISNSFFVLILFSVLMSHIVHMHNELGRLEKMIISSNLEQTECLDVLTTNTDKTIKSLSKHDGLINELIKKNYK